MRDVLYLDQIEQAEALLKPQRVEVLRQLAEPRTCTEIAKRLDQSPQRVYYHVKRLVDVGAVEQVSERKTRGVHEAIYLATARTYWLSPALIGRIGGVRKVQGRMNLTRLVDLLEQVQADVAALEPTALELPSVAAAGEIRIRPQDRQQFLHALQTALQDLFSRFGAADGDPFRLAVACYPNEENRD